MSNMKKICFDRILPRNLRRPVRFERMATGNKTRAINPIGTQWTNGSALKVRFIGGTAEQHAVVKRFAPQWTEFANLRFEFDGAADAPIRIAFADDGAWSYIGTDARSIPANQSTMNFGWLDEAVVLHEFGHAIGLAHEHQNPAGGIQWNQAAVIRDLSGPPNYWDEATIRHNVLEKYRHDQIRGTGFDPKSIMLYSFPKEWTTDGFHSDENANLSATDKAFVASERMYPNRGTNPVTVEVPVSTIQAIKASIGKAGEEDLFRFAVRTTGRYTVDTDGETDLIMKLYGPDSTTHLLAEDDDSGNGNNPQITVDLSPGQYYVQIRHYNRATGTGQYGIRVYR